MATPPLIYVLNGPNLNLPGAREPEIYGPDRLGAIARFGALGYELALDAAARL